MGTRVFRVDRSTDAPSSVEYQFHGVAGNTIAAIAQVTGTINASFNYAPFGEIVEGTNVGGGSNGIPSHRRRMNDKFVDDVSGLAYYGYRYYDKHSMTWTQGDPFYRFAPDAAWSQPRKSLLYTNDLNNPNRYMDPDGRGLAAAGVGVIELGGETTATGVATGNPYMVAAGLVIMGTAIAAVIITDPGGALRSVPFPPPVPPPAADTPKQEPEPEPTGLSPVPPQGSNTDPYRTPPDDMPEAPDAPLPVPPEKTDKVKPLPWPPKPQTPLPPARIVPKKGEKGAKAGADKKATKSSGKKQESKQSQQRRSSQPESGTCGIECFAGTTRHCEIHTIVNTETAAS